MLTIEVTLANPGEGCLGPLLVHGQQTAVVLEIGGGTMAQQRVRVVMFGRRMLGDLIDRLQEEYDQWPGQ